MISGILIIAVVTFLAVLSHRWTRLEEKVYKRVPLADWLTGFASPLLLYLGWAMIVNNIITRSFRAVLPFSDFGILALSFIFLILGFVGNSIHFTAKILWRYIRNKTSMTARVNEMFHGKLSHYLVYINSIIVVFLLPILEINHPLYFPLDYRAVIPVVAAGTVFGISTSQSIFYTNQWFGGFTKPVFILLTGLLLSLVWIFRELNLKMAYYPVSLFIMVTYFSGSMSFITRQMVRIVRMKSERRLRLLGRILSV